jgi:hypothetical protein
MRFRCASLIIAGHRIGHYSAERKLLDPLTKKQIKADEKTLGGSVPKQTFLSSCKSHTLRGIRSVHRNMVGSGLDRSVLAL